jgi:predicted metal-dependent enzyme (double-stranded beta helix superfamily)
MLFARVPARFQSGIHDHTVIACIGQLEGQERSVVYEETEDGQGLTIKETAQISAGEVMTLPEDAIHHIENPLEETSYSLHIYGGDFSAVMNERSLWTHEQPVRTGCPRPKPSSTHSDTSDPLRRHGGPDGTVSIVGGPHISG